MTSLYVHVPFCTVRCGYCDFNAYIPERAGVSFGAYLDALDHELAQVESAFGSGITLTTVFFGGGTPTLLGEGLVKALELVKQRFDLAPDAEISTEANPESLTPTLLNALTAVGFNRLSIGMQSASENVLRVLERRHTPGRAVAAVREAQASGFENINLDLIYGSPGETISDWQKSLDAALATQPTHISAYALTLEPGTPLAKRIARGEVPTIVEDDLADKYLVAEAVLGEAGMRNYEVSNWSRLGFECRHNLAYWLGDDWWGIGPGAHSHVGDKRWWNVRSPRQWADFLARGESPSAGSEVLDFDSQQTERVMLRTRLSSGVPLEWLPTRAGQLVDGFVAEGLATCDGKTLVLTARGRLLSDRIVLELLSC